MSGGGGGGGGEGKYLETRGGTLPDARRLTMSLGGEAGTYGGYACRMDA